MIQYCLLKKKGAIMFKKIKDMYKAWKFKRELNKITGFIIIDRRVCPVQKKKAKKNAKRK